jgi:CheY-like chemotaxis protein
MTKRVVVIEDNEVIRFAISYLFSKRGYEVIACPDPVSCPIFAYCRSKCAGRMCITDIIITDVSMPNMTGTEFMKSLLRLGCRIPNAAIMSASPTEAEVELSQQSGIRLFEKPVHIGEIEKWIDECEQRIDPCRELPNLRVCAES